MRDHYRRVLKDEKKAREYIEKATKSHPDYLNISFKVMEKRGEVPEDAH